MYRKKRGESHYFLRREEIGLCVGSGTRDLCKRRRDRNGEFDWILEVTKSDLGCPRDVYSGRRRKLLP